MEHCVKSVPIQSYSGPHFPAFVLYGEIRSIQSELFGLYSNYTEYSVRMRENVDQNNSEYEHFLRNGNLAWFYVCIIKVASTHCVKSIQIWSFFWSIFSRIRTEYGEIRSISPYSVRIREIRTSKNSVFGHFSRSDRYEMPRKE